MERTELVIIRSIALFASAYYWVNTEQYPHNEHDVVAYAKHFEEYLKADLPAEKPAP